MATHEPSVTAAAARITTVIADPAGAATIESVITVMSFNIHHARGTDGILDVERTARVIRAGGADIIGLQEVDRHFAERSDWADQASELAALLDCHLAYGANLSLDPPGPGRARRQFGIAVLSRYPIVHWEVTPLFCSAGQEQRGLLRAVVNVHGVSLNVYNAHTEAFSESDRVEQVRQILEQVGDASPAVLLGDFNADRRAPEISTISARLTDAWTVHDGDDPLTYPADAPNACIDYVFTNRQVQPLQTRVMTDEPVASDHLPVLSRLAIVAGT